jgi:hypothetical protein
MALAAAETALDGRAGWWFQGRELLESLAVRLAAHDARTARAHRRFHTAVERLESVEVYAAAWMVADCAAEIAASDAAVWRVVDRFGSLAAVQEFAPLAARFTALRDLADRPRGNRTTGPWARVSPITTLHSPA